MEGERLRLAAYASHHEARWNGFVRASKNGTFLLERGFMDYHADRFPDCSLMAFHGDDDRDLAAVLPAARMAHDGSHWLASHPGLTYGGWVTDGRMTTAVMLRLFELMEVWAMAAGLDGVRYKATPRCYHRLPADEDLHALFAAHARLVRQDVTSVIDIAAAPTWAKGRQHALSKARKSGVSVEVSDDYDDFHDCLSEALARHGAKPVHSLAELKLLADRFPQQIRLYASRFEGEAIAYVWVFDCGQTVHTQYMAARPTGRELGGLDAIIGRLQFEDYADRRYLSFGISTTGDGTTLNRGLIAQKEMFGGRAMVCPVFDLSVTTGGRA
jgi:hypothetical protein